MNLVPFTPESAKLAAQKSVQTRRRNKELLAAATLNGYPEPDYAQRRLSRLWVMLEKIDKRIAGELAKEMPAPALLRELQVTARSLQAQAQDLRPTNGHKKPAPIAAPPDPLV